MDSEPGSKPDAEPAKNGSPIPPIDAWVRVLLVGMAFGLFALVAVLWLKDETKTTTTNSHKAVDTVPTSTAGATPGSTQGTAQERTTESSDSVVTESNGTSRRSDVTAGLLIGGGLVLLAIVALGSRIENIEFSSTGVKIAMIKAAVEAAEEKAKGTTDPKEMAALAPALTKVVSDIASEGGRPEFRFAPVSKRKPSPGEVTLIYRDVVKRALDDAIVELTSPGDGPPGA